MPRVHKLFIATGVMLGLAGVGLMASRSWSAAVAPSSKPWFEEVCAESGIGFRHVSGEALGAAGSGAPDGSKSRLSSYVPTLFFPEIMSGGVALIDFDADGLLDVYFVQGGSILAPSDTRPGNKLYRNLGGGRFVDVSDGSGAGDTGYGMGVTCGDFDNDGREDLYITNVGPNVLLRNNGDGTFADVTEHAGVGDAGFSASAAFLDFDRDGDLDLFVVNYVVWSVDTEQVCSTPTDTHGYCSPLAYDAPAKDTLYRNNGDGTFTDVTTESGIASAYGNGLGVVPADLNGDGWIDLSVANDKTANQLWINLGDGRFRDEAVPRGVAFNGLGMAEAGMGVDARDIDGDRDLDLVMTHFAGETNTIYINHGDYFEDETARLGFSPSRAFTGFGTAIIDLNNDGAFDAYIANGRVGDGGMAGSYGEPNQLYEGSSGGGFREVLPRGGTRATLVHTSRGAAFGDYDNDGDVDIVVVNRDAPPYVLENRIGTGNHWIALRVLTRSGRAALGARVTVVAGGRTWIRDARVAYSYCSSNDPRVHFGLGRAARVESVTVTWPDGRTERFGAFAADQIVELREGAGSAGSHSGKLR